MIFYISVTIQMFYYLKFKTHLCILSNMNFYPSMVALIQAGDSMDTQAQSCVFYEW